MRDESNPNNLVSSDDLLDLREFFQALISSKWIIISCIAFFGIIGVIYSLLLPNVYESRALLAPTSTSSQSSLIQNYGSLANLAGIDINEESDSNSIQALEKLKTLSFFHDSFLPNIYLPDLVAYKSWNSSTNSSEYNEKIYDKSNDSWKIGNGSSGDLSPSVQRSFDIFITNHLSIDVDRKTNFVTIKIKHQSPYVANKWTEIAINQINSFYREKDRNEAEKASEYLNGLLAKTNLAEIKQVIAKLLQQETQKLTLIQANDFYVFEYIDPPAVMEKKSYPNRIIIWLLGIIMGGCIGVIIAITKHYFFNKQS